MGLVESHANAEHSPLIAPGLEAIAGAVGIGVKSPHDGEPLRKALGSLECGIVAVANRRRGDDDSAVDPGFVHRGDQLVRAERFSPMRPRAGHGDEGWLSDLFRRPRTVGTMSLPKMHLTIDNQHWRYVRLQRWRSKRRDTIRSAS